MIHPQNALAEIFVIHYWDVELPVTLQLFDVVLSKFVLFYRDVAVFSKDVDLLDEVVPVRFI